VLVLISVCVLFLFKSSPIFLYNLVLVFVVCLCSHSAQFLATFGLYCSACFGRLRPSPLLVVAAFALYFNACFISLLCSFPLHVLGSFGSYCIACFACLFLTILCKCWSRFRFMFFCLFWLSVCFNPLKLLQPILVYNLVLDSLFVSIPYTWCNQFWFKM